MHSENWDDLRYVLCVVETGSVLQAAKHLGVNHATVLRHVAAFEERHNVTIFERTSQGYRLRSESTHIIQAAQAAETAIREVARLAGGGLLPRSETIRITSTDTLCAYALPQFISAAQGRGQNRKFVLLSSNAHIDVLREQAHIVVRASVSLTEDLVGTSAGTLAFKAYAAETGVKKWLSLSGPLSRSVAGTWMAKNITADMVCATADSFLTLASLAQRGQGISILPTFVGDATPGLQEKTDAIPALTVPVWVAHHVEAKMTHELNEVRSNLTAFLEEYLKRA